jgi:hypothetical protein
MNGRQFCDPGDVSDLIWGTAEKKSENLKSGGWQCSSNVILVLQVMDCPLDDLRVWLEDGHAPEDYQRLGFAEVWVADYSELGAYGVVEVFGLYPEEQWGYYGRDRGKPYG